MRPWAGHLAKPFHLPENSAINLKSSLRYLKSLAFTVHARRPYGLGYGSYRRREIQKYVHETLPDGPLPQGWGLWLDERAVEYPWFFSRLPSAPGKLLDAGSTLNYDYVLSHQRLSNKTISIFTLAPEPANHCDRGISYAYGDLRECCYRDDYFDWVVSISTLEHVGMNNTLLYTKDDSRNECDPESHLQAVLELRRVLKPNGRLYLTLPFGRAETRGWLQVFDSAMVQKLLDAFRPHSSRSNYFRHTPSGWQVSSWDQCRDAGYFDRWHDETANPHFAAAEAVVCLELTK